MKLNPGINIQNSLKLMKEDGIIYIEVSLEKLFLNIVTVLKDGNRKEKKIGIIYASDETIYKIAIEIYPQKIFIIKKFEDEIDITYRDGSRKLINPSLISAQDFV